MNKHNRLSNMCGINGIINLHPLTDLEFRIENMNQSIAHRGPDSSGIYLKENVALGHLRLSIIDVRDVSNQPMHSNNDEWHIVFNGEIYNYREIRKQINYNFRTESDTEVIVASLATYGVEWFLERANGMFAFCAYNSITKETVLARDRMGIKPLYFFQHKNTFVFSSEIKGLLNSGLIKAEFNESAIDEYLSNRYVREPYTFFKNVYQLKSGFFLRVGEDLSIQENQYWDLPESFNTDNDFNEDLILEKLDEQLTSAVRYRLISDVPLGTYLSGGVDSSLITSMARKHINGTLNTYTIGFEESNEFPFAKMVSNSLNTTHHEILMNNKEYISEWIELIKMKDAPLGVPNEIPLAIMSSELKKKITVVLSGEGADELLGGYGRIFRSPFDYNNKETNKSYYDFFIQNYEYVSREIRDSFLDTPNEYREVFDENSRDISSSNEEFVFKFFHKYHVKGLLQRVDMTTMQTAVEARVPFLDHNLIDFAYREIPYDLKLKWKNDDSRIKASSLSSSSYSETLDTPKYILRKLGYKYLPQEIIERKKVGFPVPLSSWINNLRDLAKENLANAVWLKDNRIEQLIDRSMKEERSAQILWMFINIELFRKEYFNKNWEY